MLVLLLMATTVVWAETINLSTLTANTVVPDGATLTGTLANNVQISIAHNATVTLNGVTINGSNSSYYYWAGITCEGNATIELKGVNFVKGFHQYYPGIHVAAGKTLKIKGSGSLTACSNGNCAGIGAGESETLACGNIVIEGGTIIATGGDNAAGIGGGNGASCGDILISGGNITATGGMSGAGIGGSIANTCGDIYISGGIIIATGGSNAAAIGCGDGGTCGTVTIGGINKGSIYASPYTYLALADNVNNGSTLTSFNGINADVTLKRTLNAGGWNTFCAPFSISSAQITSIFGFGTKVRELGSSDYEEGTKSLTLNFTEATSIDAGKSYLVYLGSASNVENPTFNDVTIANVTTTTETTYADFVPVMNPTPLTANDKTVLFVSGGNKLTYPNATSNINGFRAYFHLKGDAVSNASVFEMSFDDESTGITEIDDSQAHDVHFDTDGIYTLDGRRIEGQPTAKGIYIQNGRKVIIK